VGRIGQLAPPEQAEQNRSDDVERFHARDPEIASVWRRAIVELQLA
jgi:hypothetical protein